MGENKKGIYISIVHFLYYRWEKQELSIMFECKFSSNFSNIVLTFLYYFFFVVGSYFVLSTAILGQFFGQIDILWMDRQKHTTLKSLKKIKFKAAELFVFSSY